MQVDLSTLASFVVSAAAVLTPPAALLLGFVPKVGPGRALSIGFRTLLPFLRPSVKVSKRAAEVALLRDRIPLLEIGQFQVVTGAKGVGKTTVVLSAVHGLPGVLIISVARGSDSRTVVDAALRNITGYHWSALELSAGARRVAMWHKFFFRTPPLFVLQVEEQLPGTPAGDCAQVASAARELAHRGYGVIVDASAHALPSDAKPTLREFTLTLGEMPRGMIEALPELKELVAALKTAKLADVVWEVFGGVPASYMRLAVACKPFVACEEKRRPADLGMIASRVTDHLSQQLRQAIEVVNRATMGNSGLDKLLQEFRTRKHVPAADFTQEGIAAHAAEKVLRRAFLPHDKSNAVFVPATAALRVVLKHRRDGRAPSVEEVKLALTETASAALVQAKAGREDNEQLR